MKLILWLVSLVSCNKFYNRTVSLIELKARKLPLFSAMPFRSGKSANSHLIQNGNHAWNHVKSLPTKIFILIVTKNVHSIYAAVWIIVPVIKIVATVARVIFSTVVSIISTRFYRLLNFLKIGKFVKLAKGKWQHMRGSVFDRNDRLQSRMLSIWSILLSIMSTRLQIMYPIMPMPSGLFRGMPVYGLVPRLSVIGFSLKAFRTVEKVDFLQNLNLKSIDKPPTTTSTTTTTTTTTTTSTTTQWAVHDIDEIFAEGNSRSLHDFKASLDSILMISQKHAHIFNQQSGQLQALNFDQAEFNPLGACSV